MAYFFGSVEGGREKVLLLAPRTDAWTPAKQSIVRRSGSGHM
jgi:hypothetical protein